MVCVHYNNYTTVNNYSIIIRVKDARENTSDDVAIVLVGNKSDIAGTRVVSTEEGNRVAHSLGVAYFETSMKENTNIREVIDALLEAMMPRVEEKMVAGKKEERLPLDRGEADIGIRLGDDEERREQEIYQRSGNFCTC